MLKKPRYLPIATTVLKVYGVTPSIVYGYSISLGTKISEQFGKNSERIARFMGVSPKLYVVAKKMLVESGLIDIDFLPLKPPVEPMPSGLYYIPSFVHVPVNMLCKLGFHKAYILTVICDVTAVKGPIGTNVNYWQWLLDIPKVKVRKLLALLSEHGYLKIEKQKKLMFDKSPITIVPTELAWREFLWTPEVLVAMSNPIKIPTLAEALEQKFSLIKK